jgi:DNA-binding response OmpR family regulator
MAINLLVLRKAVMVNRVLVPKILLISDPETARPFWTSQREQQRWQVVVEHELSRVLERWVEEAPDMIVIDLPTVDAAGLDVIRELREQAVIPIVVLTSQSTEKVMLQAYQAGVDDYIVTPMDPEIVQLKLKAWLRGSRTFPVEMLDSLQVGEVRFLPSERSIIFDGEHSVRLTNLELRLMYYLISHAGRTVTADELCQRVWGATGEGKKTTLKNVVYRLRLKIEEDPARPQYIRTVSGVGYRFKPE